MPSLGIVPGAERTIDERLIHGSPGHWVYKRATNECEVPPLDIGVQAIQLSPYRSGVAGPQHTRLLLSPAFQPCACPLALSGPGQAVASESSTLNSGPLRGQFTKSCQDAPLLAVGRNGILVRGFGGQIPPTQQIP